MYSGPRNCCRLCSGSTCGYPQQRTIAPYISQEKDFCKCTSFVPSIARQLNDKVLLICCNECVVNGTNTNQLQLSAFPIQQCDSSECNCSCCNSCLVCMIKRLRQDIRKVFQDEQHKQISRTFEGGRDFSTYPRRKDSTDRHRPSKKHRKKPLNSFDDSNLEEQKWRRQSSYSVDRRRRDDPKDGHYSDSEETLRSRKKDKNRKNSRGEYSFEADHSLKLRSKSGRKDRLARSDDDIVRVQRGSVEANKRKTTERRKRTSHRHTSNDEDDRQSSKTIRSYARSKDSADLGRNYFRVRGLPSNDDQGKYKDKDTEVADYDKRAEGKFVKFSAVDSHSCQSGKTTGPCKSTNEKEKLAGMGRNANAADWMRLRLEEKDRFRTHTVKPPSDSAKLQNPRQPYSECSQMLNERTSSPCSNPRISCKAHLCCCFPLS